MIFVTGDYHGGHDRHKLEPARFPAGTTLTRSDYVIICGDFGMPWMGSNSELAELAWLNAQPWTTLFVDGNHECFDYLASLPTEQWHGGTVQRIDGYENLVHLMRGQVYELESTQVFTMGGATSVDRALRVAGWSWFPEELPSPAEYVEARRNLDRAGWEVDYVVTHTCSNRLLSRALYPDAGWQCPDVDELTFFLDELEERLAFRHWYFGHFHKDRALDERHSVLYQQVCALGASV